MTMSNWFDELVKKLGRLPTDEEFMNTPQYKERSEKISERNATVDERWNKK